MLSTQKIKSLVWLRRDLRLSDNRALNEAEKSSDEITIVFVFDTNILNRLKSKQDRRLTFIYESLNEISQTLEKKGSQLIVLYGDPKKEIPKLASQLGVNFVFANEDYESYAKSRDFHIKKSLAKQEISFSLHKDQVIFSGDEVLKSDGSPYRVFTPWKKQFHPSVVDEAKTSLKKMTKKSELKAFSKLKSLKSYGFKKTLSYVQGGEREAQKQLSGFLDQLNSYSKNRDYPYLDSTSRLSVHLRFGTLSIREAIRACKGKRGEGPRTWLSELVWREFYFMILDQFPHVEKSSFKPEYQNIQWPGKNNHFKAWCEGRTGFPIVDAGMRQLNKTGFMHNRLRMVTASFLVKDLLVDWQRGEKYFAEKLMDYDLAANNGGWQWCASTGCDAQPYFRIFNPDSQTKKFDSGQEFVRKWVPEAFDTSSGYPGPIVDHRVQREKALSLFKSARQ